MKRAPKVALATMLGGAALAGCQPSLSATRAGEACDVYTEERCVLDVTGESGTLTYAPAACRTLAITGEPAGALTVTFEGSMSCFVRLESVVSEDSFTVVWPDRGFELNPMVIENSTFGELRVESQAPHVNLIPSSTVTSKVVAVGHSVHLGLSAGDYAVETYLPDGTRGSAGSIEIALGGPSPFDLDLTGFSAGLHFPASELANLEDLATLPVARLHVTYEAEAPDGIVDRVRELRDALIERYGPKYSEHVHRFYFTDGSVECVRGPCEWIPKPEAPDAGPALDAGPTVLVDGGHE